ncbi:hypothetical protein EYS21_22975 [Arthrobacter sp. S39]|nr:hypothetical protein EYS21_22975 [Arthrobacter sp. S39]
MLQGGQRELGPDGLPDLVGHGFADDGGGHQLPSSMDSSSHWVASG